VDIRKPVLLIPILLLKLIVFVLLTLLLTSEFNLVYCFKSLLSVTNSNLSFFLS